MSIPAFGPWLLDEQLGVGGMGEVWRATHRVLGRRIAVKILAAELTRDPRFRDRFVAEAQVQAGLSHSHIAKIQDFIEEDGLFAILMEWIPGGTVADAIERVRGPLPIEQTLQWAGQALEGLDYAHRHGVIHRDVKPSNLMIDGAGNIKVTDFGIAVAVGVRRMTTTGRAIGTPHYMSPEQILRPQSVDHRTDVYSMGVVLYEMLTGRVPFDADTDYSLQRLHIEAPPPSLRSLNPLVPEWLEAVALRCLAKVPDDRFAGCASVAAALNAPRLQNSVPVLPPEGGPPLQAAKPAATEEMPAGPGSRTQRKSTAPDPTAGAIERPTVTPPQHGPRPRTTKRRPLGKVMRGFAVACLVAGTYMAWTLYSSYRLYGRGQEFLRQVQTGQLTNLDQIWSNWTELSSKQPSSLLLRNARNLARQKLVEGAERVIASYRNDTQPLVDADWKRTRTYLSHVLEMDPDQTTRGQLRLCEGHLARIDGTATRDRTMLNQAVQDFNDAQQLIPKSPDPELGLARLYVYGLKDIDRAYAAFQQAQQRGFLLGNREKAQMADGYRERADRLWWDSRNVRGLPPEKDQVERARDDYKRAVDLYKASAGFGRANIQIVRVQSDLESIEVRLQQIGEGKLRSGTPHIFGISR